MTQGKSLAMNLCRSCVNLCKWFPVLFIVVIIVWSYYAYVIQLCFFSIDNIFKKIIYLILYHIFLSLFAWSYWKTIFTKIGTVPKEFRLNVTDFERLSKETTEDGQDAILNNCSAHLPVVNRTMHGSIRYCEKCCHIKPDRAHHCSVCGTCVLKMDHHCPWVNNCVNFTNYKYFFLFLGYSLLYCLYIALTNLEYFIKFWKNELKDVGSGRFHILFLLFISVMFAVSLVSLFGYHCYLVSVNRSTLESFRAPVFRMGPDKNGYNLGRFANFVEIFGDNKIKWFLPVATHQGDGVSFPVKRIKDEENSLMNDQHEYNIEIDSNCKDSGNTDAPSSASSDVKLIME